MGLKERAKALKVYIPAFFLAMKRRDTPVVVAKVVACITVGYALSPVDIIPDFIPVLGYLDDLVILPLLVALSVKLVPRPIMDQCMAQAEALWQSGKPRKWYYALPVIVFWVIVTGMIVSRVLD